jgi:hypothetical protein
VTAANLGGWIASWWWTLAAEPRACVARNAACGWTLLVRGGGLPAGHDVERCLDCELAVNDPAESSRLLAALPPASRPSPDPSKFTLVNDILTPELAAQPLAVSSTHLVLTAALKGVDSMQFTVLCRAVLTWDDVEPARSDRRCPPCSGCGWVYLFDATAGTVDGGGAS